MESKLKKYISKSTSDLPHNLPQTTFTGFDPSNIEEGRIYFWIKKNHKDILSSKIFFFVLQDRASLTYYISEKFKLTNFNKNYNPDYIREKEYLSDYLEDIEELVERSNKESFKEISQNKIIEILTGSKISKLLTSPTRFSIFTDEIGFDIYDNMIQTWVWSYDNPRMKYTTLFFVDEEAQTKHLNKALKKLIKSYGCSIVKKSHISECLEIVRNAQKVNQNYLSNIQEKLDLLQTYPVIKELCSLYELENFMRSSNLNIIEGDWHVDSDLELDAKKESLLITGDLTVDGTFYPGKSECRSNILIVIGDIKAKNYIHAGWAFSNTIFSSNLIVDNITYLPAASRSWMIKVNGSIKTKILIHGSTSKIESDGLFFKTDYCNELSALFQQDLYNKNGHFSEERLFDYLINNKTIFSDPLPDSNEIKRQLALLNFKSLLKDWGSIYYKFAGFNLSLDQKEDHKGCHVNGGDEIVDDIRGKSGEYCRCHESQELTQLNPDIKGNGITPSSKQLAYRFAWIMWIFSTWKHVEPSPFDYWQDLDNIDQAFNNGKPHFQSDPNLALYWILHFGLLGDQRYQVVREIMQNTDDQLAKGAMAFIDDPSEIENYKIDDISLQERLSSIAARIKLKEATEEEKIVILLDQIKTQPKTTLNYLVEVVETKQKTAILNYLDNSEYHEGFSYLFAFYSDKDQDKWHSKFLQECWEHFTSAHLFTPNGEVMENPFLGKTNGWNDNKHLLNLVEPIFDDLSTENQDKALTVLYNSDAISSSKNKLRFADLQKRHKYRVLGKVYDPIEDNQKLLDGLMKKQLYTNNFIRMLKERSTNEQLFLIKAAMYSDKLSRQCKLDDIICHYLIIFWLESEYKGDKFEKDKLIQEIIDHYDLSYKEDNPYQYLSEKPGEQIRVVLDRVFSSQ